MKIVHICAYYQDKLGYQEHYMGKAMKEMGHDVQFITSDVHFDFPDYDRTVKHIIGDKCVGAGLFYSDYGVPVHRLRATTKKQTGAIWLKGLRKKIRELQPEIIISHNIFTWHSIRLLYYQELKNVRIIFDEHTTINLARKDYFSKIIYLIFKLSFSKKFVKTSDKLIGISDTCIHVMRDSFGLKSDKVQMIPLGTDTSIFRKDLTARVEYRKKLDLNEEDILVLYTGKIYEIKNVHLIIEALNEISLRTNKKLVIHFVGDVSKTYASVLDKFIASSKNRIVHFKAIPFNQLQEVYNAADISVWPDHLTNSTIDASACGCPIICSHFMPERVKFGNGLLVKGGDLKSLTNALEQLINNDQLRHEMGDRGIKYVQKELSWTAISKKFIE